MIIRVWLLLTAHFFFDLVEFIAITGSWWISPHIFSTSRPRIYLEFSQVKKKGKRRRKKEQKRDEPNSGCLRLLLIIQPLLIYILRSCKTFMSDNSCMRLENGRQMERQRSCATQHETRTYLISIVLKFLATVIAAWAGESLRSGHMTLWGAFEWHPVTWCLYVRAVRTPTYTQLCLCLEVIGGVEWSNKWANCSVNDLSSAEARRASV